MATETRTRYRASTAGKAGKYVQKATGGTATRRTKTVVIDKGQVRTSTKKKPTIRATTLTTTRRGNNTRTR